MAAQEAPAQQVLALLVVLLAVQQAAEVVKTLYQLAAALPEEGEGEVVDNLGLRTEQEEVAARRTADISAALAAGLLAHHKLEHPVRLYWCKLVEPAVANKALYRPV